MDGLLIPVKKYVRSGGVFKLPAKIIITPSCQADEIPLSQLSGDLAALGAQVQMEAACDKSATIRIYRDAKIGSDEAYRIAINSSGVEIVGGGRAGVYYAIQTLREIINVAGLRLPCCRIEDRPDFARRGVYLDCSRGKVPKVETIKGLIEQLAAWKINEFQLYIENVFTFASHPLIGKGFSPFTPQDILDIQAHCKKHHIKFVGSLASFGHFEKILMIPKYASLGECPGFHAWPGGTTLCPTDPRAIRLVSDMYEEFLPLFDAEDFNACGDEPWELGRGRSAMRAKKIGKGKLYVEHMLRIYRLCKKHGKRMNVWADIVLQHPELLKNWPEDVVMLNWAYTPGSGLVKKTANITRAGLAAMVCPGTNSWLSHGCRLEAGMANIAEQAAAGLRAGAEGMLNTDWGDNGHRNMLAVSLHNFAWGAAHSWNHRAARADGFTQKFCRHTFGAKVGDATMANAIGVLGLTDKPCEGVEYQGTPTYNMFAPPHMMGEYHQFAPICIYELRDKYKTENLIAHADRLARLRWAAPSRAGSAFLANMLAEYALATRLDDLAFRRGAMHRERMTGFPPTRKVLDSLIAKTRNVTALMKKVWLIGNRPSRLADNLARLNSVVKEYQGLK